MREQEYQIFVHLISDLPECRGPMVAHVRADSISPNDPVNVQSKALQSVVGMPRSCEQRGPMLLAVTGTKTRSHDSATIRTRPLPTTKGLPTARAVCMSGTAVGRVGQAESAFGVQADDYPRVGHGVCIITSDSIRHVTVVNNC